MSLTIIRDALPLDLAEETRALFLATEFAHAPFGDPAQFARTFPDGGRGIPDAGEVYQTSFRSHPGLPVKREAIEGIVRLAGLMTGRLACAAGAFYFYKMLPGDHLRLHKDDYAGHTGFVWHLSKGWKWDWGGLMVSLDGDGARATLPEFNTLVVIDHAQGLPHLVTQVAPWAKEPRMTVTGILR